jgi:hypothetical protein
MEWNVFMNVNNRFYYKESGKRYRVYDNTVSVGANHMCIADCMHEWQAKIIVSEMNMGLPYRPDISWREGK